jgi:hypothetical protein
MLIAEFRIDLLYEILWLFELYIVAFKKVLQIFNIFFHYFYIIALQWDRINIIEMILIEKLFAETGVVAGVVAGAVEAV